MTKPMTNITKENNRRKTETASRQLDALVIQRGYCGIGLWNSKNYLNIGSTLRAAYIYNASFICLGGKRNNYKKSATDTMKSYRHLPLFQIENMKCAIPYDCIPIAVDLIDEATPLQEYNHPERAFYIFGPEDGTLGSKITNWCRDKVYVPTRRCMNLAASVNVVLYDRLSKQLNK